MQQKKIDRESLGSRLGCDCELRALLNSLPGAICCRRMDPSMSLSFASSAMHQLTGYRADEVVNGAVRSFESLLHPQENLSRLRALALQQLHQTESFTLQYRLVHRDGSVLWIWESGRIAGHVDGQYCLTESILVDMTDLHQQQKTLEDTLTRQTRDLAAVKQLLVEAEDRARHDEVKLAQSQKRLYRQGLVINQLTAGVMSLSAVELVVSHVCEQINGVLGASHCGVWSFEQGHQLLKLIVHPDENTSVAKHKLISHQLHRRQFNHLFTAIEAGVAFAAHDAEKDSRTNEFSKLFSSLQLRSMIVVPLHLHQKSYGMLVVEQCDISRHWYPDELNFVLAASLVMLTRIIELEADSIRTRLHGLAYFDALTQLENRQLFNEQLKDALAKYHRDGQGSGLLFLDLNEFKQVNDRLGHSAGDQLLQQVASRLKRCLRKTDHIARIGGDEFIVLLHNVKMPNLVAQVAEKLLHQVIQPYVIDGERVEIGVSIGIALAPADSVEAEELMKLADQAMYRVKASGVSSYQFANTQVAVDARSEYALISELRSAVEQEQMELVYMPQIALEDGAISGAEALLRWRHPRLGLLAPAMFIELAERNQLLKPIGEWVCQQVVKDAHALNAQGKDTVLSFNLSASQMDDAGLVDRLRLLIEESELPAGSLRIELKEDTLLHHVAEIENLLHRLHQLGVGLTIDNFGAGACAVETLTRLPIDLLKIDQRLLRDTENDPAKRSLASTMIAVAQIMGKEVVAEGIETQGQADFLTGRHCHHAQGFYYYRPMVFETFTRILH
ncbi:MULTISPECIES: bifunctional diguanylate cyclase/phosphodiesterase [Corallincola]|uniref:bifunctional diguanylate cyclase/phosphodiesterase n=1 Tax=Corallincola TaxID=1775176 RepID=UPI0013142195|nr:MULTISPECIES: EAL domain-containing protein [Corallincola]